MDGPVFFAFVLNLLLVLLHRLLGEGVSTWLSIPHLCERSPGAGAGRCSLHGRGMDGLDLAHSRVRPSVPEGLSKSDDREAGLLVKLPAIHYQLAAQHKINWALGILTELASLDEIARVRPQLRGMALEGTPERRLVPKAPASAGFREEPCLGSDTLTPRGKKHSDRKKSHL